MSWLNKTLAFFVLSGFVWMTGGCGFQPVYGSLKDDSIEVSTYLAAVDVAVIPGATGQQFRNALQDRLNPAAGKSVYGRAFRLEVALRIKRDPIVIEKDGSIGRYNINLSSNYRLLDSETLELLTSGKINRIASFSDTDEKFAAYIAEKDAMERAILELSEDYRLRLAAYFAGNYTLGAKTATRKGAKAPETTQDEAKQ